MYPKSIRSPECGRRRKTLEERFWSHVQKTEGCWLWTANTIRSGYGQLTHQFPGISTLAHRISWGIHHGTPPPADILVCHKCDVRRCVNPDHLFLGTVTDNNRDMLAKGRHRSGIRPGWRPYIPKLTEENVVHIRMRYAQGGETCASLGKEFGVDRSHIWQIIRRRKWPNVP